MKFNINNCVKVKLNKRGLDELRRQHAELKAAFPRIGDFNEPKTDKDGYSKFQLHSLMSQLGHMCQLGFETPFDTEIEIVITGDDDV